MKTGLTLEDADCVRKARNYLNYSLLAAPSLLIQIGDKYIGSTLSVSSSIANFIFDLLIIQLGLKSQNNSEDRYKQLIPVCKNLETSLKRTSTFVALEKEIVCLANLK